MLSSLYDVNTENGVGSGLKKEIKEELFRNTFMEKLIFKIPMTYEVKVNYLICLTVV